MADQEEKTHTDVRLSEMKNTEENVQKVLTSFDNLVSPFNVDDGQSQCKIIYDGGWFGLKYKQLKARKGGYLWDSGGQD